MRDVVVERSVGSQSAGVKFVDGVTDAVPLICRSVSVTGIGRFGHPYADVTHRNHPGNKLQSDGAAFTFGDVAQRESLPRAFRRALIKRFKVASPKLDRVTFRIRISPGDTNRIHFDLRPQIDHHPLRMQRVIFASERLGEIWIALPVRVEVAVGEPRPSIAVPPTEAAMRQRVCPRAMNFFPRLRTPHEVPFLFFGIAPLASGIPVPGLDHQFGILPVGNSLPSRTEDLFEQRIFQKLVGSPSPQPIDRCAQRAHGTERVRNMRRVGIDDDSLSGDESHGQQGQQQDCDEMDL